MPFSMTFYGRYAESARTSSALFQSRGGNSPVVVMTKSSKADQKYEQYQHRKIVTFKNQEEGMKANEHENQQLSKEELLILLMQGGDDNEKWNSEKR